MEITMICEKESNEKMVSAPVKIESFGPSVVFDYLDDFDREKWALRAFGELLATSDLDIFSDTGSCAGLGSNYRCGLQQLIELYLERQESLVERISQKASNSPEYILEAAKGFCESYGGMTSIPPAIHDQIHEKLRMTDQLIEQLGTKQYPEAEGLKDGLVKIVKVIQQRS